METRVYAEKIEKMSDEERKRVFNSLDLDDLDGLYAWAIDNKMSTFAQQIQDYIRSVTE